MAKTYNEWEVYFSTGEVEIVTEDEMKEIMKDDGLIYLTPTRIINTHDVTGALMTEQHDSDWKEPEPEPEPDE